MKLSLETERLILRPFTMDDAEDMFTGWASDPEVTKYLTWPTHTSIDQTRFVLDLWIKEYKDPKRINCAIETKEDHKLIGGIDIVGYEEGVPVIGYNLSRKYWGKGYMTEVCRCMLNYLFSRGYPDVRIDAVVDNIGSNKVIQKCGGELIKTEEECFKMKNDKIFTVNKYVVKNKY